MAGLEVLAVTRRALRTVRDEAGLYLAAVGPALLAALVVQVAAGVLLGPPAAEALQGPGPSLAEAGPVVAGLLALGLAALLLGALASLVAAAVTWDRQEGREASLGRAWARYGGRFPAYVGVLAAVGAASAAAALLVAVAVAGVSELTQGVAGLRVLVAAAAVGALLAAAVYPVLRWFTAPLVVLVEERGVRRALARSAEDTAGARLRVLGLLLVLLLAVVLVSGPFTYLVSPAGLGGPAPAGPREAAQQLRDPVLVLVGVLRNLVTGLVGLSLGAALVAHAHRDLRDPEPGTRTPPPAEGGGPERIPEAGEGEGGDGGAFDLVGRTGDG